MAGINGVAQAGELAVTASTEKCLVQIVAPANHRVKVRGFGVFFDGTSVSAEPVRVQLLRQTSAGTMSALTPAQEIPVSETIQTTALKDGSGTVPTAGDVLATFEVHPQSGYEKMYPLGQEIIVPGGGRLGINVLAGANVNATAAIYFEE
jgi:hypothetical protein